MPGPGGAETHPGFGQPQGTELPLPLCPALPQLPPRPFLSSSPRSRPTSLPALGPDLVSPFRQGPKLLDVVPTGRQHDPRAGAIPHASFAITNPVCLVVKKTTQSILVFIYIYFIYI